MHLKSTIQTKRTKTYVKEENKYLQILVYTDQKILHELQVSKTGVNHCRCCLQWPATDALMILKKGSRGFTEKWEKVNIRLLSIYLQTKTADNILYST